MPLLQTSSYHPCVLTARVARGTRPIVQHPLTDRLISVILAQHWGAVNGPADERLLHISCYAAESSWARTRPPERRRRWHDHGQPRGAREQTRGDPRRRDPL